VRDTTTKTKRFDGHTWNFHDVFAYKSEAEREADDRRASGELARVIENRKRQFHWEVWVANRFEHQRGLGYYRLTKAQRKWPEIRPVLVVKRGRVVASSHNLSVILRYQRAHSHITSATQRGNWLNVKYADGAHVRTRFADRTILTGWIRSKRVRGVFP